jgi:Glycosyltransferase family 87
MERLNKHPGWKILMAIIIIAAAARYGYMNIHILAEQHSANDFGHQFLAARAVQSEISPYKAENLLELARRSGVARINPFVYPPFAAVMMIPLADETYKGAFLRWTVLNHILLLASLGLLLAAFPHLRTLTMCAVMSSVAAFSMPLFRSYSAGQLNTLLLFLLCAALFFIVRKLGWAAAAIIAVAAHIKVLPLFMMIYFVWKRDWKALAVGVSVLVIVFLFTLILVPWSIQIEYLDLLCDMSYGSSTWSKHQQNFQVEPANQSISALAYRLLTKNQQTNTTLDLPGLAKAISLLSSLLLTLLVAWTIKLKPRADSREEATSAFLLLWLLSLLIPSLFWDHYMVQLLPHIILLAMLLLSRGSWWKWLAWVLGIILISRFTNFWDSSYKSGLSIALSSSKLPGALLIGFLLLHLHPSSSSESAIDTPSADC